MAASTAGPPPQELPRPVRADGSVFPPVTPDPPAPPGYRSPLADSPALANLAGASDRDTP